jgi:hypothetical protein
VSRVGRLAGALLAETGGQFFLVGHLKRPCDFPASGFEPPASAIDGQPDPWLRLQPSGPLAVPGPWLQLDVEGQDLPRLLAQRLLIERNASVSDRLWRLILTAAPDADSPRHDTLIDARWLGQMPLHLWRIVRENVLKCL